MSRASAFVLIAGVLVANSHAQTLAPKYAISYFKSEGPKGVIRGAVISPQKVETHDFCEGGLQAFRSNTKGKPSITVEKQICVAELPSSFKNILEGKPLADAIYVRYSYSVLLIKNHAWDITFLEGLRDPEGHCDRIIDSYRKKYDEAECLPPFPRSK